MHEEVEKKFSAIAKNYDHQRKFLIPCFDDFYGSILQCIGFAEKHTSFLDIGSGTGLLTSFIYNEYPQAHYTLIDISEEMITKARQRFPANGDFEYIISDYNNFSFLRTFDIVVSSLSVHHLNDEAKAALMHEIYRILNPGGVFINGDQLIFESTAINTIIYNRWRKRINDSPLLSHEKEAAFERMKLDKPATGEKNISLMREAGFKDVELIYKYFPFGVFCGFKK